MFEAAEREVCAGIFNVLIFMCYTIIVSQCFIILHILKLYIAYLYRLMNCKFLYVCIYIYFVPNCSQNTLHYLY